MKKIVLILIVIAMSLALTCTATAEEDVYLRLKGGSGTVGDTVTVTVAAENAPECKGFTLFIEYDPTVLEAVSVEAELQGDATFSDLSYDYNGKKVVRLEVGSMTRLFSGNTGLATIEFRIISETSGGFGTVLNPVGSTIFSRLDKTEDDRWMVDPIDLGCRVYVGEDEPLSTAHAVEIMRHLIGKSLPADRAEALDWDGNGSLNIADAILLLRELN